MRRFTIVAVVAMLTSLVPVPATADTNAIALFGPSLMHIGSVPGCSSTSPPSGPGLHMPASKAYANRHWYLNATIPHGLANDSGVTISGTGAIELCGEMAPVMWGIGAACGASIGHSGSGVGYLADSSKPRRLDVDLVAVGWPTQAGGSAPLRGVWFERDANEINPAKGPLTGVIQFHAGSTCVSQPNGFTQGQATGVIALL